MTYKEKTKQAMAAAADRNPDNLGDLQRAMIFAILHLADVIENAEYTFEVKEGA